MWNLLVWILKAFLDLCLHLPLEVEAQGSKSELLVSNDLPVIKDTR